MAQDIELAPGIVANRMIMSGAPCIRGRRLSTEWITGRFSAGDSVASIAEDYDISTGEVEAAIRYEYRRVKKRKPRFYAGG